MIRIQQLKIRLPHDGAQLDAAVKKALGLKESEYSYQIVRRSLDARRKPELYMVYTIDARLKAAGMTEERVVRQSRNKNISVVKEQVYQFPAGGRVPLRERPVVVGTGPAGLFCGLMLARSGYRPILLERGQPVEQRIRDVEHFFESGELDPESNVQFGEGGAGTFSDGKLNTLVKDSTGRNRKVLEEFVRAGAGKEILYESKPHIGTDVLAGVVRHIRDEIIDCGGEVRFQSKVTGLLITDKRVQGVILEDGTRIPAYVVVLAIGHSARDTFYMLQENGVPMQAKPFAVGVRVEHPQAQINGSQYGIEQAEYLPAADYKLTARAGNGRSVYSFCMCPGGYVVNASSEPGRLAVNGMSYSGRDGENANSAIIVSVGPEDYGSGEALAGIEFQRKLEEKAYWQGGGRIPVQTYEDFKADRKTKRLGNVRPQLKGRYTLSNVRSIFPQEISQAVEDGMEQFGRKIQGFNRNDCLLSGVESRTSSPVRIIRDDGFESAVCGLYPCGEGAGYAGGITSAAMDGIKVAEAVAGKYRLEEQA